ncbi:MAG: hypothetical protein JWR63_1819, partial [Conexibacter sp.]|nr:hypothetical protein [Conexibacter sp.]
ADGTPLAVIFCPRGCTVGVDGRLALHGRATQARATSAAGLTLVHRTLKVTAARPGVVRLALTKAQRTRIARARSATITLTLRTKAGGRTRTVHRAFTLHTR